MSPNERLERDQQHGLRSQQHRIQAAVVPASFQRGVLIAQLSSAAQSAKLR